MKILEGPLLSQLTTLRLGGTAIAEIRLECADDYGALPDVIRRFGGIPHALGGGSNLLVRDGDLPFLLLRPGRQADGSEPQRTGEDQEAAFVRADAGIPLPRLVSWCARMGLSGLEGLAGVPGHLGGAIAMNAGAYGCSTAPLVTRLAAYTPEQGLRILGPSAWECSYRHFSFLEPCSWSLIAWAELRLVKSTPDAVRSAIHANLTQKKQSQPITENTAGCIFKNPEQNSAGRLLDAAGVKDLRKGAFHFSRKHANFLVHDTGCGVLGTFEDAISLIQAAQERVHGLFGIELEREVIVWA